MPKKKHISIGSSQPNLSTHHPDGTKIRLTFFESIFGSKYGYKKLQDQPSVTAPLEECCCAGDRGKNKGPSCFG